MTKGRSGKTNNGCLNIFKFLKLLYEDDASYDKVTKIFKEEIESKKDANILQVVLNKYINALKVFGIKIVKEKNKFKLQSSLYSMKYSAEDLKAISILLTAADNFPDDDIVQKFKDLTSKLLLRMRNPYKATLKTFQTNYDFSFFYTDFKDQIEKCKYYCENNHILNITYMSEGKETVIKCNAIEMIYDYKTAYLKVYNITTNENEEIPLPNILSIIEQPNKAIPINQTTTVVYKIKGRLAKSYKPKEGEYIDRSNNGEIYIVNKNEPIDKLLARLMRYADLCEIISPKYLRARMIQLIKDTLNIYENKNQEK